MYPIINIFGRQFGTYGICMCIAVLLVAFLATRRGKRYGIAMEDIAIVGALAMGIGLVCGCLTYCFVTYPMDVILERLKALDFTFLFGGGIVFYGALIGAIPGAMLGIRIAKCKTYDFVRTVVPFIPLGHGIGRIGCLLGGCCHGMPYDGPLAVYYRNPLPGLGLDPEQGYFPVQPLETLFNLVICGLLLLRAKKTRLTYDLLFDYLGLYAISRFILEYFRGDEIRGIFGALSTSQWISVGLLVASGLYWGLARRFLLKKQAG